MKECKLPLRTVLQNFINNVESLEAKSSNREDVYEQEFQELKKLTESLKTHPDFVCTEGEKECNRRKNRYKDILPYDKTRVVLQAFPGIPGSDYINANYIRGASGSRAYIASQGPLPNTVPDFWRMVVECDVQVIIMASNETEGGKHKCECYWVEKEGEEKQFGNVLVSFIKSRQVCPDFLVRTLKIKFPTEKDITEERTICQFHYMLWPDHGVPDTVRPLLHMVRLVRDCQASETLPVLVHCSAGCGRTGTICAIDYVWGLLRTGKLNSNLYLLGLVREMRVQRVAMVQTKEQYCLLHQAVKELFRERLSLIDSHPYENVATDGNPISMQGHDSKESDYEELFMSYEKQDHSMKPATVSHSSGTSLTSLHADLRNLSTQRPAFAKDTLRRSASASSLDFHKVQCKDQMIYQPSTSASFDASLRQVESHSNLSSRSEIHDDDPCKAFSKLEKELENITQREYRSKEMKAQSGQVYAQRKSKSNASTPTSFVLGLQELALHVEHAPTATNSPVTTHRSRTPSPISLRRKELTLTTGVSREDKKKNSEIVRRPSIQKLKELFERPHNVIECPNGMRLSRSASSVTPRSNLSLHNDDTSSLKSKKKSVLGSDQSLSQIGRCKDDTVQFQICPPPPFNTYKLERESAGSGMTENSLPVQNLSFLGVKRKVSQVVSDHSKGEKNKLTQASYQDERPALPIKKSKSFRWARSPVGQSNSSAVKNSEFLGERNKDNYFSLDRGKENSSSREAQFENTIKKIGKDFFPPYQDGLKLSVYEASHKKLEQLPGVNHYDKVVCGNTKPQIPPKKSKKGKLLPLRIPLSQSTIQIPENDSSVNTKELETPLSAPPSSSKSFENKEFWDKLQLSCLDSLRDDLNSESSQHLAEMLPKNSKNLYKNSENSVSKVNKDYVNAKVLSKYVGDSDVPKMSYVPLPSKRESKEKNNHDYVNCSVFSNSVSKFPKGKHNADTNNPTCGDSILLSEKESKKNSRPSSDYEPVDFGENISSVDEVFETLNYGLIEKNEKPKKEASSHRKNYYLNKDLDSLAIQVYQDCQAYLLHGSNQCPVPSLLPQTSCKEEVRSDCKSTNSRKEYLIPSLEEVKNKVSVPPQGLRNRERRNSYRQAVNTVSQIKNTDKQNALKKTHKYEKIWFDSMKEELDGNRSPKADSGNTSSEYISNFNYHMNISAKETLFKDKLEELQGFVSNLESKKLPDLSEEELSSKDSGSTSSLLSRSAQSSRSSERVEPIYANALPGYRSSTSSSEVAGKLPSYSLGSATSPYGSPYGTLATTTSYPYKQKIGFSHQNTTSGDGVQSYGRPSNAATLPARTTTITSYQNIPPPRGFGSPPHTSAHKDSTQLPFEHKKELGYSLPPIAKEISNVPDSLSKDSERNKKGQKHTSKVSAQYPEENQTDGDQTDRKKDEKLSKSSLTQKKCDTPSISCEKGDVLSNIISKDYSVNSSIYYHIPSNLKSFPPSLDASGFKKSKKEKSQVSPTPETATDNEDDSVIHKVSSNSSNLLLRKLKGSKVVQNDATSYDNINKDEKDRNRKGPLSPPGSPHSFSKAFGKLKMGSKSVAANFKSYLSSKNNAENQCDGNDGSQRSHYPLQKSVSSGPSVNVFIQEVEDSTLSAFAPKTSNNRELPHNFRCYDHTPASEAKTTRARQQYL